MRKAEKPTPKDDELLSGLETIRAWVRGAGFARLSHDKTEMWHTEVYARYRERRDLQGTTPSLRFTPRITLLGDDSNSILRVR